MGLEDIQGALGNAKESLADGLMFTKDKKEGIDKEAQDSLAKLGELDNIQRFFLGLGAWATANAASLRTAQNHYAQARESLAAPAVGSNHSDLLNALACTQQLVDNSEASAVSLDEVKRLVDESSATFATLQEQLMDLLMHAQSVVDFTDQELFDVRQATTHIEAFEQGL